MMIFFQQAVSPLWSDGFLHAYEMTKNPGLGFWGRLSSSYGVILNNNKVDILMLIFIEFESIVIDAKLLTL
jgi:hypothetical protein